MRRTRRLAGKVQRLPAGILAAGASLPGRLAALGVPRSGAAGLVRPLRPAAPAGAAVERRPTGAAMPGVARGFHFAPYSRAGGSCTGRGGRNGAGNPAMLPGVARMMSHRAGPAPPVCSAPPRWARGLAPPGYRFGAAKLPATAVAPSDTPHQAKPRHAFASRARGMPSNHGPEARLRTTCPRPTHIRCRAASAPLPHGRGDAAWQLR